MGMLKNIGAGVVFPFSRALRDISTSSQRVHQSYREMAAIRQQKHEDYEAAKNALGAISEQEKFAQIYEMNGWSEAELQEQARASRRTRLALLCTAAVGMVGVIGLSWIVKWWVMMILGPVCVIYLAACAALSIKFAWYEYQIETRSITPIRAFLARPDLFARMFG